MTNKVYNSFTLQNGQQFNFDNYLDFSTWFFSVSRNALQQIAGNDLFNQLNKAANNSSEAKAQIAPIKTSARQLVLAGRCPKCQGIKQKCDC